jgi:hypothetical protein
MIIAMRKRKRLLNIHCRDFEIVAPYNQNHKREYETPSIQKKIFACASLNESDLYFAIFTTKETGKTLLVFQPDERMLNSFKSYLPRKVFDN